MAISQIGGSSSSSSSAAAPIAPAGYATYDGGVINTGRYALATLPAAGFAFASGDGAAVLRDKTNGYYYQPTAGYTSSNYVPFSLTAATSNFDVVSAAMAPISSGANGPLNGFIAKAGTAWFSRDNNGRLTRSTDGTTWSQVYTASVFNYRALAYNGSNLYIAVHDTGYLTSTDGITWTVGTNPNSATAMYNVIYGNGIFLMTGFNGTNNFLWSSTDGATWTARQTTAASNRWFALAHNGLTSTNSLFIAYNRTSGTYVTSTDGITWTSRTAPVSNDSPQFSYGNNLWVYTNFAGSALTYYTSPDGITWTSRTATVNGGNVVVPTSGAIPVSSIYSAHYINNTWWFAMYASPANYQMLYSITDPTTPSTVNKLSAVPLLAPYPNTTAMNWNGTTLWDGTNFWYLNDGNGRVYKMNATLSSGNAGTRFQLYSDAYRTLN